MPRPRSTPERPLQSAPSPDTLANRMATEFEKRRGIARVEGRAGYAQVHVSRLKGNMAQERIRVLSGVANKGVSIDFLKLTPSGLSFLIPESLSEEAEQALEPLGVRYSIRRNRSIVIVEAVNIRDEEGLTATIVQHAIASGAGVDHVTDMHNRLLMVVPSSDEKKLVSHLTHALEASE